MNSLDKILLELIDKYRDEDVVLDRYEQEYAISPEDLLVERESRKEAIELVNFALDNLTEEDKNIIQMYVLEGLTLEQVGNKLGYHRITISNKLGKIPAKLKKIYNKHKLNGGFNTIYIEGESPSAPPTFEEMRDLLFYRTPKVHIESTCMGFPHEFLQVQYKWSAWYRHKTGKNAGLTIWKTANQCLVREYLAQSFKTELGEVVCTLCPKCKRSDSYIKISKL